MSCLAELFIIYLFIYLFKINDRRTRGPLILPEVHKNTQKTQHKLNKGKKYYENYITDWFFSALHGIPAQPSDEKGVCPSVRPSVCLPNACKLWQNRRKMSRFLSHTKDHLTYSFLRRRMVGGVTPFTWNFGSTVSVGAKSIILKLCSLVVPQP